MKHPIVDEERRHWLRAGLAAAAGGAGLGSLGCAQRDGAPDVEFVRLDGSRGRIGELRGKVLFVNFWATSCASCVAEMPELVATHKRYHERGYETLAVAMSYDPPAYVSSFTERRALPFWVALDNTGAVAKAFGDIRLTPTSFLIDKRSRIVKRYVGMPDFKALHGLIEELLIEA